MEINFENREIDVCKLVCEENKRIQLSVEAVVPDSCGDIYKLISIEGNVLLKSKDVHANSVEIRAEAAASVFFIAENEQTVEVMRVSKEFSIEFDTAEAVSERMVQFRFSGINQEGSVLNPRKVSVSFEINGTLSCYKEDRFCVSSSVKNDGEYTVHTNAVPFEYSMIKAVNEKTFSLNENFTLPEKAEKLLSAEAKCIAEDVQAVGTKLVVKGKVYISAVYRDNDGAPYRQLLCSPFSQIIDSGTDKLDFGTAWAELTSEYYEIIDTISGDKALDAEIHGVIQIAAEEKTEASYIADAYCNCVEVQCEQENVTIPVCSERHTQNIAIEELLPLPEECERILCILTHINRVESDNGAINAELGADIIFSQQSGEVYFVHRLISKSLPAEKSGKLCAAYITDENYSMVSGGLNINISLNAAVAERKTKTISRVMGITLAEENSTVYERLPAFTLVRVYDEDIWTIAKEYKSSIEKISEYNDISDICGKMLLVPKSK